MCFGLASLHVNTPNESKSRNWLIGWSVKSVFFYIAYKYIGIWMCHQYGCFESFPFRQKKIIFVRQITWFRWTNRHWTSGVNVHNKNSDQLICAVLTFDPQLKKNLNILCKRQISIKLFYLYQRLQCRDYYFFKIKFVSFFICCCQYHETKTICLYIFLISDIYWGTEHQYLFSRFLGVSILQLLII
jgi:hypothetical protein